MTGSDLLEKMSLMDVSYVEKANEETKKALKGWHRWRKAVIAAAACLAVAAVTGILLYGGLSSQNELAENGGNNNYTSTTTDSGMETETTENRELVADASADGNAADDVDDIAVETDDNSAETDDNAEDTLTSADDAEDTLTNDAEDTLTSADNAEDTLTSTDDVDEDAADASAGADGSYEETVTTGASSWDEMGLYQKYSVISVSGVDYTANSAEISADQIAEELATVTVNASYEESELSEEDRTCEVQVYAIKNISAECAVAVQYQDSEIYYAAVNPEYQPDSLGQLLQDLNLESTLEIGAVWYYKEGEGFSESTTVEMDESKIWELLSLDADRTEVQDQNSESGVRIAAKIPLIGYEVSAGTGYGYVSIKVCEGGYLIISIPDTGDWIFAIGEDAAEKFISYAYSLGS